MVNKSKGGIVSMRKRRKTLLAIAVALLIGIVSIPAAFSGEKAVFVDFSWSSVQMHNRIAGFILEHGYGYSPEYIFAESVPGLTGLQQGDIDIAMEMWIDNLLEWYDDAVVEKKLVLNLGPVFPRLAAGVVCPYLYDQG